MTFYDEYVKKMFGWEILFKITEHQIMKESDVMMMFVHWILINKGGKCLSSDEKRMIIENEYGSELLPAGWNNNPAKYVLRYSFQNNLHILYGIPFGNLMLFNFLNVQNNNVTSATVNMSSVTKSTFGRLEDVICDHVEIIYNVNKHLFPTERIKKTKNAGTAIKLI